jgi:hypothetical protein
MALLHHRNETTLEYAMKISLTTKTILVSATLVISLMTANAANAERVRDHRGCSLLDINCRDHRGPVVVVPPRHVPPPPVVVIDPPPVRPLPPPVVVIDPPTHVPPGIPPVHTDPVSEPDYETEPDGISCREGRQIVRQEGFRRVRAVDCDGPIYSYNATKRRHKVTVLVNLDGDIVRVKYWDAYR